MESLQIICPSPPRLNTQPRSAPPSAGELASRARHAIEAIDRVIGRRTLYGSVCATCRGPIAVTDTSCPNCGINWLATEHRAAARPTTQSSWQRCGSCGGQFRPGASCCTFTYLREP